MYKVLIIMIMLRSIFFHAISGNLKNHGSEYRREPALGGKVPAQRPRGAYLTSGHHFNHQVSNFVLDIMCFFTFLLYFYMINTSPTPRQVLIHHLIVKRLIPNRST